MFSSAELNRSINDLLVAHRDPHYGRVCVPYFGSTKDDAFTRETESAVLIPDAGPVFLETDEKCPPTIQRSYGHCDIADASASSASASKPPSSKEKLDGKDEVDRATENVSSRGSKPGGSNKKSKRRGKGKEGEGCIIS